MNVISSSTRAAYISACTSIGPASGKLEASSEAKRVGRGEQRQADLIAVTDQHRQRHGLAQRAAEAQHQRCEDAAGGGRQHHLEDGLPLGGAHAVGGLLDLVGDAPECVDRDRRHGRQDHDRQHQRGRRHTRAAEVSTEQRKPGEVLMQPLRAGADHRDQHINTPETIDHRRNRREQLDSGAKHQRHAVVDEVLGQEDGDRDTEQPAKEQRQQGAVERTPDLRQDTENALVHVPGRPDPKTEPVILHGGHSLLADFPQDEGHQHDDEQRAEISDGPEQGVCREFGG